VDTLINTNLLSIWGALMKCKQIPKSYCGRTGYGPLVAVC
jgi:hypothetical protein